jgi:hypothetical protein
MVWVGPLSTMPVPRRNGFRLNYDPSLLEIGGLPEGSPGDETG